MIDICEASDGQQAFAAVAAAAQAGRPFDVVFIDSEMPVKRLFRVSCTTDSGLTLALWAHAQVMNGPTATSKMRSMGFDQPIIGITGSTHPADLDDFRRQGATEVWTKPIELSALATAVKAAACEKASGLRVVS